jgi:alpha-L-fucosidase 2
MGLSHGSGVDWAAFLGRHDLVWEQLPLQWNEAAFVGNGLVGMMIYAQCDDNRIDFHLGRSDVTDHRKAPDRRTSMATPGADVMYDFPRLDVGRMALRPAGKILSGTVRLDLWNAEVRGTVVTDSGEISFRAFTPYDRMVNVVEVTSTGKIPEGNRAGWEWEFLPGNPAAPAAQIYPGRKESMAYVTNPAPSVSGRDGTTICVQPLLAGGDYATAWKERGGSQAGQSTLFLSTANEVPASGLSARVAVRAVEEAAAAAPATLVSAHREWWHAYYAKSFLSIPDTRLESFYWMQIHKLGCCTRPEAPALDLFGPFFRLGSWPGLWWNLNIQLAYWPVYASNHLELGANLIHTVDDCFDDLLERYAKGERPGDPAWVMHNGGTLGDLTWVMHNYWWQFRFAGDWNSLKKKWVPKAGKLLGFYQEKLERGADGKLHLAPMGSPEYKEFTEFPDTTYNLALLRWLLNSLMEIAEHSRSGDAPTGEWSSILRDLTPFPEDENGLMIAGNQSVDMSHRHFSHLLALYPLFQLDPDSPHDRELVARSVRHWLAIENGKKLAGYSFTAAASLLAALGEGEDAVKMLDIFLTKKTDLGNLLPNGFYAESHGKNPTIETPFSGASAIMDLLLQSWGGQIRVFPAVPPAWRQASFHQLRAQGGFLVSASRENGRTRWVTIESLAGEPCRVKVPDWTGEIHAGTRRLAEDGPHEYLVDLKIGESVVLSKQSPDRLNFVLNPNAHSSDMPNTFGVKKGKELPAGQFWPGSAFAREEPHQASIPMNAPQALPATNHSSTRKGSTI